MSAIRRSPMASSPPSYDDATHQDTPSTIPTTFSPEAGGSTESEATANAKPTASIALPALGRMPATSSTTNGDDVFLNAPLPTPTSMQSELSPTADVFTPGIALTPSANTPRPDPAAGASTVGQLLSDSTPEDAAVPEAKVPSTGAPGVIGQGASNNGASATTATLRDLGLLALGPRVYITDLLHAEGIFSAEERVSRSFLITNASTLTVGAFQSLINTANLQSLELVDLGALETHNVIAATFTDILDARQAFALCMHSGWQVSPLNPREAAFRQRAVNARQVSLFEGQITVTLFYDERSPPEGHAALAELRSQLANFGAVKAMCSIPASQRNMREFRVEYFDLNDSTRLLMAGTITTENFVFNAHRYAPDIRHIEDSMMQSSRAAAFRPSAHLSATGRSTVPAGTPGYEALLHTLQDDAAGRRNAGHAFTRIDVYRITLGLDVRTTVMLRNIPNRVTSPQLKEIIDQTSRGDYDFMYLRIDFANNCNVGYAFINFVDPLAIIPFAEAHQGQRWDAFNSDKVAEISYATIQGRENLIEKFRNSSVMLEHPDFRPKLLFTGRSPFAGEEEPFPEPNNLQKMRRSVENAEHVGLYRPDARFQHEHNYSPFRRPARRGCYGPPARAGVVPFIDLTPPTSPTSPNPQPAEVDVNAPNDPFTGRSDRLPQTAFRLFAPRQGQQLRVEQRRRRSQFDRGTPGAELEMADFRGAAHSFGAVPGSPSPTEYRYSAFR